MFLKIIVIFFILSCNSVITFSQQTDSVIKEIRLKYNTIQKNLSTYDTAVIDLPEVSVEGGNAIGYYEKGKLKLLKVLYFGETGKSEIEYYFDSNKLFFAFERDFSYNRPIYWNKEKAKELQDTAFDPAKTIISEDRYYFQNEKLIRWLDNSKNSVNLLTGTNTIVGQGLKAHAYKIRSQLKN